MHLLMLTNEPYCKVLPMFVYIQKLVKKNINSTFEALHINFLKLDVQKWCLVR